MRRHLAPAAREWEAGGRPDDELYRGARLTAALDWAGGPDADVTPLEREFLDASEEAADAELTAQHVPTVRRARHREAAARHRTRRLAAGLAAVLVVALVATFLAVRAQRDAQRASLIADANRLAALSTTAGRLDLSLLLAVQAVRLADTPETQDGLLAALTAHGRAERAVPFGGAVQMPTSPEDGDALLRQRLRLGDVGVRAIDAAGMRPADPGLGTAWTVSAPSPTDDVLMAAGTDGGRPWVRLLAAGRDLRRSRVEGDRSGGLPVAGRSARTVARCNSWWPTPNDATRPAPRTGA